MKKYITFKELDKAVDKLIQKEEHKESLQLFNRELEFLPIAEKENNYFEIMWTKTVLYTNCGLYDDCMQIIQDVIEHNFSFPMDFKRFEPLQERSEYKKLKEINDKLVEELNVHTKVKYKVFTPENYNPNEEYKLAILLHGHGIGTMNQFIEYWKPDVFINKNFIAAYIQSSQVICHNGFGWLGDYDKTRADIKSCYDAIVNEYSIDKSNVVLGGYSGGAISSMDFALYNIVPIIGVIALCPSIVPDAFTQENVVLAAKRGVKMFLIEGELELPVADEDKMISVFEETHLPYKYYINKGVGHRAPDDFDSVLEKAIKFIFN